MENLKPGQKEKDPEKGWFIVNENGAQVFLKDDYDGYVATYKQYHEVQVLSEHFNERARKILWQNTDEKNG